MDFKEKKQKTRILYKHRTFTRVKVWTVSLRRWHKAVHIKARKSVLICSLILTYTTKILYQALKKIKEKSLWNLVCSSARNKQDCRDFRDSFAAKSHHLQPVFSAGIQQLLWEGGYALTENIHLGWKVKRITKLAQQVLTVNSCLKGQIPLRLYLHILVVATVKPHELCINNSQNPFISMNVKIFTTNSKLTIISSNTWNNPERTEKQIYWQFKVTISFLKVILKVTLFVVLAF